jgi:DNA-binding transcriptional MerR regulator
MAGRKKKYYRIGEVSKLAGVEAHIIRYWESVFPSIKPRRSSRQRLYRAKDVDTILYIKKLLYEEGYTIAGAKKRLSGKAGRTETQPDRKPACRTGCAACMDVFMGIRSELVELVEKLQR